jgi:hypothetical protein
MGMFMLEITQNVYIAILGIVFLSCFHSMIIPKLSKFKHQKFKVAFGAMIIF